MKEKAVECILYGFPKQIIYTGYIIQLNPQKTPPKSIIFHFTLDKLCDLFQVTLQEKVNLGTEHGSFWFHKVKVPFTTCLCSL